MSILVIKIIACISMIIDHIKYAFPVLKELKITIPVIGNFFYFKYLGRIAFPLFAFCLVEGYRHTRDLKKYICRLLIFGIVSQPIFFPHFRSLFSDKFMLNIMFTLLLGLFAIMSYDKMDNKILGFIIACGFICLGKLLKVDYGAYGVATCFLIYLFRDNKLLLMLSYIGAVVIHYSVIIIESMIENGFHGIYNFWKLYYYNFFWSGIFSIIAMALTFFYNGKKGKGNKFTKYFFYIFYPAHLAIICLLARIWGRKLEGFPKSINKG